MKAWLITWDWTGDAAAVADRIAGILSVRKSPQYVAEIVEFLYAQSRANIEELAAYAKNRNNVPYRAKIDFNNRIRCGHNPFLFAEQVSDLTTTTDPETGIETISWLTQPEYKPMESGPELVSSARSKSCTRVVTGPLSNELMWDRKLGRFKDKFKADSAS